MPEERLCPNCNQPVETGVAFCGNCGFKMEPDSTKPQSASIEQVYSQGPGEDSTTNLSTPAAAGANIPPYAIPHHHKQHWAVMALAFGILGIGASALIPILGIGLGICGIVLISLSFRQSLGWLKPASLVVSILAVAVGIGFWVYAIDHNPSLHPQTNSVGTSNGVTSINVYTPCYSLTFATELNVNNSGGSCSMNAYNGTTFQNSSNVYKVVASQSSTINTGNFASDSKQAINQDLAKNLAAFKVFNQSSGQFDGSPAYYVQAYDSSANVAVIEEAILHDSSTSQNNDNVFVIVHATGGQNVNLQSLESTWQWND
jgi:hypothetical protein